MLHPRLDSLLLSALISLTWSAPVLAEPALHATIDERIAAKAGGAAAGPAEDGEFFRRVHLDLAGIIPAAEETRAFLADGDAGKREKLIDRLLAAPEYSRRMQEAISVMLLERREDKTVPDAQWEQYLRDSFAANKPWDALVHELLFTESSDPKQPAPPNKFFLVAGRNDQHQRTQDVARLLLGRDIMCAQCHNHPVVDDYLQADYFGLFSYIQDKPEQATNEFESVFLPGKKTTGPKLPGGEEIEIPKFEKGQEEQAKEYLPKKLLARDLPTTENELFVRNSVNRFWFLMMGRGLVHPLDLHHEDNPPSHPELLDALAADFIAHKFDVKYLLREIALSQSYQRSSLLPDGVEEKDAPPESYRAAIPKPLSPEQMAWAVMRASGNLARLEKAPVPENSDFTYYNYINGRIESFPENLPDAMKMFVGAFANPPGEAEVDFNPAMGHALFLMNEPMILDWLKPRDGNLLDRLTKLTEAEPVADELYLSVLTRIPSDEEKTEVADYLETNKDRREDALGELTWALLSSAEFRLNH